MDTTQYSHTPVLYEQILDIFRQDFHWTKIIVDATLWLGWHAIWVIDTMSDGDIFIWFDADIDNLAIASEKIKKHLWEKNIKTYFINSNFANLQQKLREINIDKITHIYYDFWVNSIHYDNPDKWFSFRYDGPLDLRYNKNEWISASEVINTYEEKDLKRIFYSYWEEKKTPFIVAEIVKQRKIAPIIRTLQLAELIEKSSFDPKSKIRIFQALRIEVNKEFEVIEKGLSQAIEQLKSWWIMACITFHSLEDWLVKGIFNKLCENEINNITWQIAKKWVASKITKKPIIPSEDEIKINPRSRSAKLRIIQKN